MEVAEALNADPRVALVNYPGLKDFPGHDVARRQHHLGLHGGVLSFELHGGYELTCELLKHIRLCTLVEHVGSVETLLTHPASMTHADVPPEQLAAAGLTPGLVRLSVGLEDPQDIIQDLKQAIDKACQAIGQSCDEIENSRKGEEQCQTVN